MADIQADGGEVTEIRLGPVADSDGLVDVWFTEPDGRRLVVPAFASGGEWKVRYSSVAAGTHHYEVGTPAVPNLAGVAGTIDVTARPDQQRLAARGPLRIAPDGRHLEHSDGTPFFWLADTWWYGFAERLELTEFREFAAARAEQGFSVIQIVAGLYPESLPQAAAARSRSGWVWDEEAGAPNPEWFDEADHRIAALADQGLVPCIVGAWGHYYELMDSGQLARHWREMIARWAAYPVVWCLAGEASLTPAVDVDDPELRSALEAETTEEALRDLAAHEHATIEHQLKTLNDVARTVRAADPFGRLVTIHSVPFAKPWEFLEDESVVDFWLLQTGHQGHQALAPAVDQMQAALDHRPAKPVINGEPSYEGIAGSSWQDIQRFMFWSHVLSGAAGHSYGAHGIWGFNTSSVPGLYSGLAPHWRAAADLPGSRQLGLGRRMLAALPWHEFEPHPEWLSPSAHPGDRLLPYAAGLREGPRVFYFPPNAYLNNCFRYSAIWFHELGDRRWRAELIDPVTGAVEREFGVEPEPDGSARLVGGAGFLTPLPSWADWLVVLHPEGGPR
ncbi:apiosidase-like domain-containing protein [Kribbella solani]|uniref:apiosidase-like domain-containing protein n=1 Tax=Kribbella solani TaxID=236067 RepID=UPI0029BB0EE2|nr:DUF4038 domain-containing protein [Kribbella solani]MDX2973425.1 DUF4038 domain-containing protein [Kribbella solani]